MHKATIWNHVNCIKYFYMNVKMTITYEFIVVHSFGTIGGYVPGINSILLTTIFRLPVGTYIRS